MTNPTQNTEPPSEESKFGDTRTLARGMLINLLGTAGKISRWVFTLFIIRVFSNKVYGLFAPAVLVVDIVSRFTLWGMDKSLLKYIPESKKKTLNSSTASWPPPSTWHSA